MGKSSDFETINWRFPNTDQCPLKNCMLSCSSRKNCLTHFHMHHAEICMMCTICDELFLVVNPLHLLRHYQIHHPNERPPKLKEVKWHLIFILFFRFDSIWALLFFFWISTSLKILNQTVEALKIHIMTVTKTILIIKSH